MSRVLHLVYSYYESDPRVRRLAEALAQAGHRVDVVALQAPGAAPSEVLRNVYVERLLMERHRGDKGGYLASYGAFLARAFMKVAELHQRHAYDLIHVSTMPDVLVFAAIWPRLRGAKVVLDFHDMMPELFAEKFGSDRAPVVRILRAMERISAGGAHHCLAVHDLQKDRLVENGIPADKITVVLNAPDETIFVPQEQTPHEGFVFVYHGTIAPRHGLDLAVRAFARARRTRSDLDLRFRIVGSGDGLDALKAAIADESVGHAVELLDPVPVERIPGLVGDADLAVIPLRGGPAGAMMLPTKLLEYAALGVPSIVSRTPVVEHYFPNDSVAFLPPGDVEALADEMVALAVNEPRRRRMSEVARSVVERHAFSIQRRIYCDLVERLCSGPGFRP